MRAAAFILVALAFLACHSMADTPAQCLYPDFEGPWIYYLGPQIYNNAVNCSQFRYWTTQLALNLTYPDIVVSGQQQGFWTRIYNQGAEITINGNKFFAFSLYKTTACYNNTCTYTSYCNQTFNGWYHDLSGQQWGCFYAHKQIPVQQPFYATTGACNCSQVTLDEAPATPFTTYAIESAVEKQRWIPEKKLVEAINKADLGWKAKDYPEYATKTMRDMTRRAGGKLSRRAPRSPIPALEALVASSAGQMSRPSMPRASLPTNWDWTNVSNTNFVSPVRDQGDCGSCYAFGTTAALEARIRIGTRNQQKTILSPQNIVSCSEYSQGCEGGFPYLVSKFGEDFQQVSEQCFPYANSTPEACSKRCNNHNQFYYDTNYYYVGGYFGACTEQAMMEEVFYSGPVAVSFEVYSDFIHYSGGIYTHHNSTAYANFQMNPFEVTNHAVCLVGWGVENGVPFWKVKNSWGTAWGEQGYFRILRGMNECAIEEMAVAVTPVFN